MNKTCNEMKQKINLYIDGELPEDEKHDLRNHLETCSECQKQLKSFQKTADITSSVLSATPDINFDEVWKNVKTEIQVTPSLTQRIAGWLQMPKIWVPAMAICTGVLVLSISLSVFKSPASMQISRVESVSSQSGMYMVLETAQTKQPLIWFSEPQTKESQS